MVEVVKQSEPAASEDGITSTTLPTDKPKTAAKKNTSWQDRLLPLMRGMLVALTIFFFLVTLVQMSYLHWSIARSPAISLDSPNSQVLFVSNGSFEELYQARQLEIRAAMERYIVEKRYHQISVLQMSGLWLRYMGFITGMILAMVGASFILGKLRVADQELEGKYADFSLSMRSSSPGIILALLGVILMFGTLMDNDTYTLKDANIYLPAPGLLTNPDLEQVEGLPPIPDADTGGLPEGGLPALNLDATGSEAGPPVATATAAPGDGP